MKNNQENYLIPDADIYENNNEFILEVEMPGVNQEGLEIDVNDNKLNITGHVSKELQESEEKDKLTYREYQLNDYKRSFSLGNTVDVDKITATMKNGVLTVALPKSERIKPKKILIQSH